MTAVRQILTAFTLAALLLGAGCGGGEKSSVAAETDEPDYKEAKRLENAGRYSEALLAYRRVIQKRGEDASPESHLDSGNICLDRIKNPIEALHEFNRYLTLQQNSKLAPYVKERVEVAKREFARTLSGPNPLDAVQPDQQDTINQLQRENERLKAENDQLRAGQQVTPAAGPMMFHLPVVNGEAATPELRAVPPPTLSANGPDLNSALSAAPVPPAEHGGSQTFFTAPPKALAHPAPPSRPNSTAPVTGRRHTIEAKDTLYRISVKYFGNGSRVDDIFNANRDVMPNKNTLPRIGTELKIP